MKNNKLYAAAMLADEIVALKTKATLIRNLMNDTMNEKISKLNLERSEPEILALVAEAYKEQCWKIDIVSDYVMYIDEKLQELEALIDKYYGEDEKFIQDIASLIREAIQNNGKVSSKRISSILGKGISDTE